MNIDSTAFLVGMVNAIAKRLLLAGCIVQTLMNEAVALWKPLEKILVIDIIYWNMKVMIAAYKWRIILELPIDGGDDMCDIAVLQGLCAS